MTKLWLGPAPYSGRPRLGPYLAKVSQTESFAAITEGVVLCAHFERGSTQTASPKLTYRPLHKGRFFVFLMPAMKPTGGGSDDLFTASLDLGFC